MSLELPRVSIPRAPHPHPLLSNAAEPNESARASRQIDYVSRGLSGVLGGMIGGAGALVGLTMLGATEPVVVAGACVAGAAVAVASLCKPGIGHALGFGSMAGLFGFGIAGSVLVPELAPLALGVGALAAMWGARKGVETGIEVERDERG